jgi:hypothetical protein
MTALDFLKALGVALAVLCITLAASYLMVTFYALIIEPGHPQEFYSEAAQWIAPWASHILGPVVFFAFNFSMAKRSPRRHAMLFAVSAIVLYAVVDLGTLPIFGLPITASLNMLFVLSLLGKTAGALLGAHFGVRARNRTTMSTAALAR